MMFVKRTLRSLLCGKKQLVLGEPSWFCAGHDFGKRERHALQKTSFQVKQNPFSFCCLDHRLFILILGYETCLDFPVCNQRGSALVLYYRTRNRKTRQMPQSAGSSIVTKCAQVIDVLAEARRPLAFSEIAEKTGFVKSSCHRILAVLSSEELVEYDDIARKYQTGERLRSWSRWTWRRIDLQELAHDEMVGLSEEYSLNVALSVRDDDSILYLRTVDHLPLRYAASTGDHAPLHCTAAGKVFLANMTEARRNQLVQRMQFERLTEKTVTDASQLLKELRSIETNGYAVVFGEEFLQVTGMAAPIRGEDNAVVACLSAWSAEQGSTSRDLEKHSAQLIEAAKRISKAIGWITSS